MYTCIHIYSSFVCLCHRLTNAAACACVCSLCVCVTVCVRVCVSVCLNTRPQESCAVLAARRPSLVMLTHCVGAPIAAAPAHELHVCSIHIYICIYLHVGGAAASPRRSATLPTLDEPAPAPTTTGTHHTTFKSGVGAEGSTTEGATSEGLFGGGALLGGLWNTASSRPSFLQPNSGP